MNCILNILFNKAICGMPQNGFIIYQGFCIGAISGSFIASSLGGFIPTFKLIAVLSIVSVLIALMITVPGNSKTKSKNKKHQGDFRSLTPDTRAS